MNLNELIERRDALHLEHAAQLHTAHRDALDAAQAREAELREAASDVNHREALADLIQTAALAMHKSKTQRDRAGLLIQQYAAEAPVRFGAASSVVTDGAYLIRRLDRARWLSPEDRLAVTGAMVFAASGGDVETGLMQFSNPWWSPADTAALEELAGVLCPDELAKQRDAHAKLDAEHADIVALCGRLDAGAPVLHTVSESLEEIS